ncbi:exodeoxyribonuclease VII small subunit [Frankia sp. R82]|uniref:exodeoxyribonuclease VII small subunit n=1 Tax=Frankia sp. R82 TaxID=2950553 RepID=UPI002043D593|nr:exodeoxyribonuclease VII small subunit [Frankia sp. R82]MCM3883459.1 exodeoxyribonuclease VII small subunit [Frankia sp. R82]
MPESSRSTTTSDIDDTGPADASPRRNNAPSPSEAPAPGTRSTPGSYEQARAELEEVVHQLEAGGVTLEQSLALWERGEQLAHACQAFLDGARARLAATDPAASATPQRPQTA